MFKYIRLYQSLLLFCQGNSLPKTGWGVPAVTLVGNTHGSRVRHLGGYRLVNSVDHWTNSEKVNVSYHELPMFCSRVGCCFDICWSCFHKFDLSENSAPGIVANCRSQGSVCHAHEVCYTLLNAIGIGDFAAHSQAPGFLLNMDAGETGEFW